MTVLSLLVGLVVGMVFKLFNLPIPAPGAIEGILGIIGIFLGFKLMEFIKNWI